MGSENHIHELDKLYTQSDKFKKVHIATWHAHGEEAIQPDSLETICPARLTKTLCSDLEQVAYTG